MPHLIIGVIWVTSPTITNISNQM